MEKYNPSSSSALTPDLTPGDTSTPQAPAPSTPPPAVLGWSTPLSDYELRFQKALADAGGTQNLPYRAMFIQSHVETGGGTSRVLKSWNNGFGIHGDKGAPNKFWDGSHQTTSNGEVMRVYKSLDLSIGDYIAHIQAMYPLCIQAAHTGDIKGYFAGLVSGGYAEDPKYYDTLLARYKTIYGADA